MMFWPFTSDAPTTADIRRIAANECGKVLMVVAEQFVANKKINAKLDERIRRIVREELARNGSANQPKD